MRKTLKATRKQHILYYIVKLVGKSFGRATKFNYYEKDEFREKIYACVHVCKDRYYKLKVLNSIQKRQAYRDKTSIEFIYICTDRHYCWIHKSSTIIDMLWNHLAPTSFQPLNFGQVHQSFIPVEESFSGSVHTQCHDHQTHFLELCI